MNTQEIIAKIKTMPGMNAIFCYGMKADKKFQDIFSDVAVRWMQEHGLIDQIIGEDTTPPGFLCTPRKFTVIMLNSLGLDVVKTIQAK